MIQASAGATAATATGPLLGESRIIWIALGIGLIALVVVLQPWLLARSYHARRSHPADAAGQTQDPGSFFQIPFITWFLIHHGIAALALLAIVFLGIDNVIDKGTVSALIGSLLGYALGSAANSSRAPASSQSGSGGSGQAGKPIGPVPGAAAGD